MMADHETRTLDEIPPPSAFSALLGIEFALCTPEEVVCSLVVTEAMGNRNGVLHGGALMALADTAASTASFINSPAGVSNTTIETKTNFIRPVLVGETLTARCVPVHVGRFTIVLQVTTTRPEGKVAAVTLQTQMLLSSEHRRDEEKHRR